MGNWEHRTSHQKKSKGQSDFTGSTPTIFSLRRSIIQLTDPDIRKVSRDTKYISLLTFLISESVNWINVKFSH